MRRRAERVEPGRPRAASGALGALLSLVAACGGGEAPAGPRPRHVVLVVLDSVRADHVGAYGYERETTPRLDRLAEGGLVFDLAYAGSSVRTQSLSTLWTGRLPSSGGHVGVHEAKPHPALDTLPRLLARAGYQTGLVSNLVGLRERAFTRGFHDVEVDSQAGRWSGERVTAKGLEILDQAAGGSVFLALAYGDAGEPHLPPGELRARIGVPPPERLLSLRELRAAAGALPGGVEETPGFLDLVARYDAELAHVDRCLGALVDGLVERGLLEDTLLVVTSTHGTELLEHGYVGPGWTLYEEVIHVPLVVHAPALVAPGRFGTPVSHADVLPTLARVLGLPRGASRLDGAPFLEPGPAGLSPTRARDAVIAELVVPELSIQRACIRGDWKLLDAITWVPPGDRLALAEAYDERIAAMQDGELERPDPWGTPVRRELFDLARDPGEQTSLGKRPREPFTLLGAALMLYERSCRAEGLAAGDAARRAEVPEDADELQQLGYL